MKLIRYANQKSFAADALDVLMENEVQNNLPIGFITSEGDVSQWLLATVKDDSGAVQLVAACTPPFNIVLYERGNRENGAALDHLVGELKGTGMQFPGVLAEQGLANRFAAAFAGEGNFHRHCSMYAMRLDSVNEITEAPGHMRELREDDMFFAPYWDHAFCVDCGQPVSEIPKYESRLRAQIGKGIRYYWEDGYPVSQAATSRATPNGAVIAWVYTPPHYRGKGYASSLVAELSQLCLDRGNKFCCLFADAANPISCGIYRKLGYRDQCLFDEIHFTNIRGRQL